MEDSSVRGCRGRNMAGASVSHKHQGVTGHSTSGDPALLPRLLQLTVTEAGPICHPALEVLGSWQAPLADADR